MVVVRALMLISLCLCGSRVVRAQQEASADEVQAKARELFTEGGTLLQARDYGRAEGRFREALALFAHPPIAYNLALSLEKQGRFKEALEVLQAALGGAFGELDVEQQTQFEDRKRDVSRLLARLRVRASAPGRLRIDGHEYGSLDVGREQEVLLDPGAHLIVVEFAQGHVERTVRLATRGVEELTVTPPPTWVAPEKGSTQAEETSVFESPWFWLSSAVAVGGVVAAVVLLSSSSGSGREVDPVWGVTETLTGPL